MCDTVEGMDVSNTEPGDQLERLGVLAEPVRRRLYDHVAAQAGPVDRDAAARAVGIGRPLAAFHLDRLVTAGLLEVEFHRRSGRTGPGAGRPAKFYRRAAASQVDVSLPPRRYSLAAEILADGIDRAHDAEATSAVLASARRAGEGIAAAAPGKTGVDALLSALVANGYEPTADDDGTIRLRNCPFHALVDRHRSLTCSMNLALLDSVAGHLTGTGLSARAQPADGYCCVAFVAEGDATA